MSMSLIYTANFSLYIIQYRPIYDTLSVVSYYIASGNGMRAIVSVAYVYMTYTIVVGSQNINIILPLHIVYCLHLLVYQYFHCGKH